MTGKISEDPDLVLNGTEKYAASRGGANYGVIGSTLAAWMAALAETLTNKTINAANNTISNLGLSMFASGVVDTDTTLAANSDGRVATQKAVKAYADALIAANDAMVFKGVVDCSANPNYPAADRGWTYKVSVAGKIGGGSGINVEIGDMLICITDGTASGNQATVGAAWSIVQANVDGSVTGPASSTDGNFALFNGASGKVVKDSGIALASAADFKAGTANKLLDAAVRSNTPCFVAHKNGTNQTGVVSATWTQLTFGTEVYDIGNYFASNVWTPPAGKVHLSASFYATGTIAGGALVGVAIAKNGANLRHAFVPSGSNFGGASISCDDVANGTDTYSVFIYVTTTSGTATVDGGSQNTHFSGHWLSP
ncbi:MULTISPECIES: hypothetical protein [unclassified Bradyrhizobium]|uniref:hypothetical protein n=1 Tax=unclassified Bradyrhizobium TaxID=2631580 RepID=UPI002915FEBD|nr:MULTISPECIES: hypothetical protein [unclassified Bradyrhizobium]